MVYLLLRGALRRFCCNRHWHGSEVWLRIRRWQLSMERTGSSTLLQLGIQRTIEWGLPDVRVLWGHAIELGLTRFSVIPRASLVPEEDHFLLMWPDERVLPITFGTRRIPLIRQIRIATGQVFALRRGSDTCGLMEFSLQVGLSRRMQLVRSTLSSRLADRSWLKAGRLIHR